MFASPPKWIVLTGCSSHFCGRKVYGVEDATLQEVKDTFKDYDPKIRRVIEMIPEGVRRWPLMVTVCPSWSSEEKNVVLMVGGVLKTACAL